MTGTCVCTVQCMQTYELFHSRDEIYNFREIKLCVGSTLRVQCWVRELCTHSINHGTLGGVEPYIVNSFMGVHTALSASPYAM